MPFCMNCGQKLPDGAKFCGNCGTPQGSLQQPSLDCRAPDYSSNFQYEVMLKCPNCGSSIGKLDAVCPYCGAQVVNREVASSVKRFAEELSRIESEAARNKANNYSLMDRFHTSSYKNAMENAFGNKALERKISFINAFPIPNTVEEIAEFILLAVASIDVEYGTKSKKNTLKARRGFSYDYTDVKLAKTWVNKMEHAYNKAQLSFPNHPTFLQIKKIYENKMKELNRL